MPASTGTESAVSLRNATMSRTSAIISSRVLRTLASECAALAETGTVSLCTPAASASCAPRRFGTSAITVRPGSVSAWRTTCATSAICGNSRAGTNEPTSISRSPAAYKASIHLRLSAVGITVLTDCRPSRGPTSLISTVGDGVSDKGSPRLLLQRQHRARRQRHGGDAVLGIALHHPVGVGEIDQGVALDVHHADHPQLLEHERDALVEHFLLLFQLAGVEGDGPDLAAGDRRLGPVLGQPERTLEAARLGARQVAGHARHLGVVVGLDDDLVVGADQLEDGIDFADRLGARLAAGREQQRDDGEQVLFHRPTLPRPCRRAARSGRTAQAAPASCTDFSGRPQAHARKPAWARCGAI